MGVSKRLVSCAKKAAAIFVLAVFTLALFPGTAFAAQADSSEGDVIVFECANGEFTAVYNGFGALDSNGNAYILGPWRAFMPTMSLPPIKELALGSQHAVALDIYGKVHFWGVLDNDNGLLDPPEDLPEIVEIAAEGYTTLLLTAEGQVLSIGTIFESAQDKVPELPRVTKIGASHHVSVALAEDGTVYGWRDLQSPVPIETAKDVAAVLYDVIALDEDGFIHGDFSPEVGKSYQYLEAPTSGGFVKLFAGYDAAAAIDANGKLSVWGYHYVDEKERKIIDVPENLPPVKDVAFSSSVIAALCEDGKIYMWGPASKATILQLPAEAGNAPGGASYYTIDGGTSDNSGDSTDDDSNPNQTFAFPDLCWQTLGYAQRALADIPAAIVDIRYIYAPNMLPGMVVGQWPAAGDVFSLQAAAPVAVSLHVTTNDPAQS